MAATAENIGSFCFALAIGTAIITICLRLALATGMGALLLSIHGFDGALSSPKARAMP